MNVSTPSGRCGPCCSTAATGSTAIQRDVSAPATSSHVISSQSRFGSMRHCPCKVGRRPPCTADDRPVAQGSGAKRMRRRARPGKTPGVRHRRGEAMIGLVRSLAVAALASMVATAAGAQALDKVTFGTNWVAEAEHGGFYQAAADGTYRKYGLDVTIVPGGPQVNNRILVPVGKMDFVIVAGTLQAFDAVEQNIPTVAVASMFQKDPQVLLAHPDQGIDKFEDLKKLTLL